MTNAAPTSQRAPAATATSDHDGPGRSECATSTTIATIAGAARDAHFPAALPAIRHALQVPA